MSEVIEVEKDIQRRYDLEKARSREWLDRMRKEMEESYAREEQRIAQSLHQSLEEAKRTVECRASDIVQEAEQMAERLAAVRNDTLSRIVTKHVRRILPE